MKYFFSFFLLLYSFSPYSQTVEKTLAVIEGEMISLMDLKEARQRLMKGFMEESMILPLFDKSQLQKKDSTLLQFLIYEKLLDISVQTNSLEISDLQLRKELNNKIKKRGLSKKAFSRQLVKSHFTSSSYKEFLKKSMLRKILIQREIIEKIRISDTDINEYAIQTQGKALFTSFEYELTYLLFPLTKEGKKKAKKTFELISKDPVSFEKWQPEERGETKNTLKNIKLSTLHPSIKEKIKKISIGQVSSVLPLATGYHIFKVLWKTPIITERNQKRKEKLAVELSKKKFKEKLKNWLEEKKKTSFIQLTS